jgi:hypothetical protein
MMSEINNTNNNYERVLIKYRDIDDEAREVCPPLLPPLSLFHPSYLLPLPSYSILPPSLVAQSCSTRPEL